MVEQNIGRVLELARRHLQMDVSFLSEFSGGKQVCRMADGQADSFGIVLGEGPEIAGTYCRRMLDGQLPPVVPDARADHRLSGLPATSEAGIGSYLGVPLRLSDGTLYGTFCCLSHKPEALDERDAAFMSMLAEVMVEALDAQQSVARERSVIEAILAGRALEPAFQPIVMLDGGGRVAFEALARFPSRQDAPEAVFRSAYSVGLGEELERLAVAQALEFLPQIPDGAYLSLNISPAGVPALALPLIRQDDESLARLVLEITESSAVEGYEELREQLAPFRARGLRVAIDDAGAGYASLHHIVELAPDIIKVDRSLISGIASDKARRSAVGAVVTLASDLDALTVAEGLEDPADLDTVREIGVTCGQGYLLGRPLPGAAGLAA